MLKDFLYKLRYKKASEELEMLIAISENNSEKRAALGNEFLENKVENQRFTEKINKLYTECEKLEKLLNSNKRLIFYRKTIKK